MCCFRLYFSDFNVLFFQKIKNLLQFTFEKKNCCAKREKKITCREEKSQVPPPRISNGPSLNMVKYYFEQFENSHKWKNVSVLLIHNRA